MQFPANADDMLLSGTLEGGLALSSRAQLVDESIGQGHVVMFAIRHFWRWQTQGTFAMGFNAILNWNYLDACRTSKTTTDKYGSSSSVDRRGRVLSVLCGWIKLNWRPYTIARTESPTAPARRPCHRATAPGAP